MINKTYLSKPNKTIIKNDETMKILALTTTMDKPEAEIFVGLAKLGISIHVLGDPADERAALLREAGITIDSYTFKSRFDLEGMRRIRRAIAEYAPDIIYALTNRALSTLICSRVPKHISIIAYRGTVGHLSWVDPTSWFTYLNPRVDKILCVSKAVERYLRKLGISQKRLVTIYKGHQIGWYAESCSSSREDLGIPSNAFVVGCTAVMRRVKGVDDLIEAVKLALEKCPDLHLLLVGSIKDPAIEQALADFPDKSRIHLTGFRDDAASLAQLMDVTVMASKSREGFPKSVIEAMAQGVPPIVTDVGGMPELVGDGVAGELVKPCSPDHLSAALTKLYHDSDRREELGVNARRRIEEVFSVGESVKQTFEVLKELRSRH